MCLQTKSHWSDRLWPETLAELVEQTARRPKTPATCCDDQRYRQALFDKHAMSLLLAFEVGMLRENSCAGLRVDRPCPANAVNARHCPALSENCIILLSLGRRRWVKLASVVGDRQSTRCALQASVHTRYGTNSCRTERRTRLRMFCRRIDLEPLET